MSYYVVLSTCTGEEKYQASSLVKSKPFTRNSKTIVIRSFSPETSYSGLNYYNIVTDY